MGFLRRLILQVKIWLKTLTAPAADPRQTFAFAYQRQRELLLSVQQALTSIAAAKARLEAKTAELVEKLPGLEDQARRALIAKREDLARLALQRREIAAMELQALEEQVRDVRLEEERLSLVEHRLAAQIEAFHARQEVIAARYSAAEAQVRITESLAGLSQELSDLGTALEEAEQKAQRMQARASAIDELVEAGVLEVPGVQSVDELASQFSGLDVGQAVEHRLTTLRLAVEAEQAATRPDT